MDSAAQVVLVQEPRIAGRVDSRCSRGYDCPGRSQARPVLRPAMTHPTTPHTWRPKLWMADSRWVRPGGWPTDRMSMAMAGPKFDQEDSGPKKGTQGSDLDHVRRLSSAEFGCGTDFCVPPTGSARSRREL